MSEINARRSRPKMQNYGIHQGDEGLMEWAWVDEQMAKSRNYWICTVRPNGKPHAVPVWGVWVEGKLYFGSDTNAVKARNLRHSPELVVHLESGDDTVIIEGTAEVSTDAAIWKKVALAYAEKYPPFAPDPEKQEGLNLVLMPRVVMAWLESDFPKTATRWDFNE